MISRFLLIAGGAISLALMTSCADKPPELPYGTVQQMMANEVQPTSDIYWMSVGASSELIDGQPVFREWKPETDEEWAAVAASAVKLRTLAETLGSPAYADERGAGWTDFTEGLAGAATQAEQAALAKDADAVFEAGGTLYTVCSACHQAFPPEAAEPGAAPEPVDMTPNQ